MNKSILIVDDNVDLADGLMLVLEDSYSADVAYNAEEALEKMKLKHYDWVLSDVKMPGMNGVELKKNITENTTSSVMLMSGYRVEQLAEEVTGMGPAMIKRGKPSTVELRQLLQTTLAHGVLLVEKEKFSEIDQLKREMIDSGWCVQLFTAHGNEMFGHAENKKIRFIDQGGTVVDSLVRCLQENICDQSPIVIFVDTSKYQVNDDDPFKAHDVSGCLFKPFYFDKVFEVLAN
ncbi:MAG: response regulator [Gammaproteobacteria bacterium]|nr:response regulator [Gammaproteobacteria bacterium]